MFKNKTFEVHRAFIMASHKIPFQRFTCFVALQRFEALKYSNKSDLYMISAVHGFMA